MMKKFISLLLALCLVFCASAALASEYTSSSTSIKSTVTMTIDQSLDSFVVVIPAGFEVDARTKQGTMTVTLKSGWELICRDKLNVALNSSTNAREIKDGNLYLINTEDSTQKAAYTIDCVCYDNTSKSVGIDSDGYFTSAIFLIQAKKGEDNTSDISATITVNVSNLPSTEGDYTDVLNFVIS